MTWRQFARAIEADARRRNREAGRRHRNMERGQRQAERAAMQRHRQLQISQKELAKQTEKAQAAHQFEQFENYLELLVSLHKDWGDGWDWNGFASASAPPAPQLGSRNELVASEALRAYSPGFFDKLFGGAKKRTVSLEVDVVRGRAADQAEHEQAIVGEHEFPSKCEQPARDEVAGRLFWVR